MQVSGIETHTCTGVIRAKVGHPLITLSGAGVGDEQTFLWLEYVEQQVLAVFFPLPPLKCNTDVYQHEVKAQEYFGLVCLPIHLSVHLLSRRCVHLYQH